jgi:hypothetical protein
MTSGPNIKDGERTRKPRRVTLAEDVNERLDQLQDEGENISALTEEALRVHPKVARPKKKT